VNKYKNLILLTLCAVFSNYAFAANTYYAYRALDFFANGIWILILASCLGSWVVGKGNRIIYNLSLPLIYIFLFFAIPGFWRDIPSSLYYITLFLGLMIYAIIIKKLRVTKTISDELKD